MQRLEEELGGAVLCIERAVLLGSKEEGEEMLGVSLQLHDLC